MQRQNKILMEIRDINTILEGYQRLFGIYGRAMGMDRQSAIIVLECLYCIRKDIPFNFTYIDRTTRANLSIKQEHVDNDPVLSAMTHAFDTHFDATVKEVIFRLADFSREEIVSAYPELIDYTLRFIGREFGRTQTVEFAQPQAITDVICHILKQHGCQSVYNPFAGMCSYSLGLDANTKVSAQELNLPTYALALLRLDAHDRINTDLYLEDSIESWAGRRGFDAIVATPPFGLSLRRYEQYGTRAHSAEEFYFESILHSNINRVAIGLVSSRFCFNNSSLEIRRELVEEGLVDTVISLPRGAYSGTGLATCIIVLSFDGKRDSIRFIDASDFFTIYEGAHTRQLNAEAIVALLNAYSVGDEQHCKVVPYEELRAQNYSLISGHYIIEKNYNHDTQKLVMLGDLFSIDGGVAIRNSRPASGIRLSPDDFKRSILEAVNHKAEDEVSLESASNLRRISGPHVVVSFRDEYLKVYIHSLDSDLYINPTQFGFIPGKECASLEYLANYFLEHSSLLLQALGGSTLPTLSALRAIENQRAVVEINQIDYVSSIIALEVEKQKAYLAAEQARYGFSQSVRDLSHILGTPLSRQNDYIDFLKGLNLDPKTDVGLGVKSLIDVCQYINRVITTFGQELDFKKSNSVQVNITEFANQYLNAWQHFGRKKMAVHLNDMSEGDISIIADPDMIMILFDTLLDNAYRHGFNKGDITMPGGNKINIEIQPIMYREKEYVRICFMNNGRPLADGFTVKDYITKGRFSSETGRTGLGGYHIYSITSTYGGCMTLSSDSDWPFIVDLRFPVASFNNSKFDVTYDDECI